MLLNTSKIHHLTADLIRNDPPCVRQASRQAAKNGDDDQSAEECRCWGERRMCEALEQKWPSQLLCQSSTGSGSASRGGPTHGERRGARQSRSGGGGSRADLDLSSSSRQTRQNWPMKAELKKDSTAGAIYRHSAIQTPPPGGRVESHRKVKNCKRNMNAKCTGSFTSKNLFVDLWKQSLWWT